MKFDPESIPDSDALFRRVPANRISKTTGLPTAGAFTEHGAGMSVDWSKYSTPEEAHARSPVPNETGIARLNAGELRALSLSVLHAPSRNRAHSNVTGIGDDLELRAKISKMATMVVPLPRK